MSSAKSAIKVPDNIEDDEVKALWDELVKESTKYSSTEYKAALAECGELQKKAESLKKAGKDVKQFLA